MIMLGLGVVQEVNVDEYSYSITPTYMNPIWMCDQSMLGILYSNVEHVRVSYDVMLVCVVYSP